MNKRILIELVVIFLFCSCSKTKQTNEKNRENQYAATLEAETSSLNISELPLGFEFGMSEDEVDENINQLINDKIITVIREGVQYEYIYTTKNGYNIRYCMEFGFYENELYLLTLEAMNRDSSLFINVDNELDLILGSAYKKIAFFDDFGTDDKLYFNMWFHGNQIVSLRKDRWSCQIVYKNAPIYKIILDKATNKYMDEAKARLENREQNDVDVKNSSWDGSVSQVKEYLKNNLSDNKSYESIDWSEVSETPNGYMVRHKFRAKNGFGGYVIENKIFYLNKQGCVVNTVDYQ